MKHSCNNESKFLQLLGGLWGLVFTAERILAPNISGLPSTHIFFVNYLFVSTKQIISVFTFHLLSFAFFNLAESGNSHYCFCPIVVAWYWKNQLSSLVDRAYVGSILICSRQSCAMIVYSCICSAVRLYSTISAQCFFMEKFSIENFITFSYFKWS